MIVGQRNAASQGNAEARDIIMDGNKDGLFSNVVDPVLKAINSMAKNAEQAKKDPEKPEEKKSDEDIEKENKKKNLELFTQTAGIFPRIQNSKGNTDAVVNWFDFIDTNRSTLNELLIVGTYNDPSLLKMIQQIDDCIFTGGSYKGVRNNSIILPIKFDFTIHGVSGLKVGDVFKIDDLPKKYRTKIFQIMRINHSLDDNGWFTQVESQIRNTDGI